MIPSRKVACALLYSDVRDFTGFAEAETPEAVVSYLNRLMTLQVEAVRAHDGDVDKMIGDALLARFDGPDAGRRAIDAAKDLLNRVDAEALPRGVGVGVYEGVVISGAVGARNRRDFTVIGDAVNVSARLCSAAAAGELVSDTALAGTDFGPAETLQVKGRQGGLEVRRWSVG